MSIVKTSDVSCDVQGKDCEGWTPAGVGITDAQAREEAKDSGWIHRRALKVKGKILPAQDVCPKCQAIEREVSVKGKSSHSKVKVLPESELGDEDVG